MSEHEYQQKLVKEALEAKAQERVAAHNHLRREYARYGLSEADRDEVMSALGVTEHDLVSTPDSYVARALSRAGLTYRPGRAVMPRTPPSRGA